MKISTFKKLKLLSDLCRDESRGMIFRKFAFHIEDNNGIKKLFAIATDGHVIVKTDLDDDFLRIVLENTYDLKYGFYLTEFALSKELAKEIRYKHEFQTIGDYMFDLILKPSGYEFVRWQNVIPTKFKSIDDINFNGEILEKAINLANKCFTQPSKKPVQTKLLFTNSKMPMKILNRNNESEFVLVMPMV